MKTLFLSNKFFTHLLLTSVLLFLGLSAHAAGVTRFYHHDGLGSVVNTSDSNGNISSRTQFDAWGNKRYESNNTWNRFGFTGHEHDQESDLIYAKARYLDPDTGRFLSQDNWQGDTTNAPSLHRYLYAYQNPTVYVDPDGNVVETVWDVANIALGVKSFRDNYKEGNYVSAAVDAVGVGLDTAAAVLPLVPGGVGAAIKGSRAAADKGVDALKAADNANDLRKAEKGTDAVPKTDTASSDGLVKSETPKVDNTTGVKKVEESPSKVNGELKDVDISQTKQVGQTVYRQGSFADDAINWEGNFVKGKQWAKDNPITTPDYAKKYGLPRENTGTPDWVVKGRVKDSYTTRPAPASHNNPSNSGGGTEVLPKNLEDVKLDWFHMPD